jgi:hypothetical protein
VSGDSNVLNLTATATALRDEFVSWQCHMRRFAMREAGGRPSEGMWARVVESGGDVVAPGVIVVLAHVDPVTTGKLFEAQFRRTQDPLERYEKIVTALSAEYYQYPNNFTGMMTALFNAESAVYHRLAAIRFCELEFRDTQRGYRLPCEVSALASDHVLYKATYWHNAMFNPNLPPEPGIIAFAPDWIRASRIRD